MAEALPSALIIEAAIVVLGLYIFMRRSILSRGRSIALTVLSLVILAFTSYRHDNRSTSTVVIGHGRKFVGYAVSCMCAFPLARENSARGAGLTRRSTRTSRMRGLRPRSGSPRGVPLGVSTALTPLAGSRMDLAEMLTQPLS